jgi:hypothetical protein
MGAQVLAAAGRWDNFASFMVPRRPGAGGCVCMVYRNSSLDMPARIAHMRALCVREPGPGVPAYVDGGYVGIVALFEAHGFSRICPTTGRSGGKRLPCWPPDAGHY